HPFGTLKMRMGATHFLMKRLPRVATKNSDSHMVGAAGNWQSKDPRVLSSVIDLMVRLNDLLLTVATNKVHALIERGGPRHLPAGSPRHSRKRRSRGAKH
ncbi:MAG: hypothetical protein EHM67_02175, partial [Hyphomicrobiaceae bacterium]